VSAWLLLRQAMQRAEAPHEIHCMNSDDAPIGISDASVFIARRSFGH